MYEDDDAIAGDATFGGNLAVGSDNDENDTKPTAGEVGEYDKLVGRLAKEQAEGARKRKHEASTRVKYTERELIGPKGLSALREEFKECVLPTDEKSPYRDLTILMEKLEMWAHRLCPSMDFDDFLAKTEQLGRKRATKTFMTNMRLGMNTLEIAEQNMQDMFTESQAE